MIIQTLKSKKLAEILKKGGLAVIPTDTIYGLVGQAISRGSVEKIYQLKGRRPDKPLIILIGAWADLGLFKIKLTDKLQQILERYWPGQVSIVLPCPLSKFSYLHRGTNSLAFRFPKYPALTALINQTGPLVAPSANPEGLIPAGSVAEAQKYFDDKVDIYVDAGKIISEPSTLIAIENGKVRVLRPGAVKIKAQATRSFRAA